MVDMVDMVDPLYSQYVYLPIFLLKFPVRNPMYLRWHGLILLVSRFGDGSKPITAIFWGINRHKPSI